MKKNASVEAPNIANAIKFEEMTEEDMSAISTKASETFENSELYTILGSLFGSNDTINTDYNYDYSTNTGDYTIDDSSLEG